LESEREKKFGQRKQKGNFPILMTRLLVEHSLPYPIFQRASVLVKKGGGGGDATPNPPSFFLGRCKSQQQRVKELTLKGKEKESGGKNQLRGIIILSCIQGKPKKDLPERKR